jgi:hypothetical protein
MLDTGLMKHHRPCTLNPAICFCNHEAHEEKDKHEGHEEKKGGQVSTFNKHGVLLWVVILNIET